MGLEAPEDYERVFGTHGRLYDDDGVTLLNTVTAHDDTITSGGLAFRAFGSTKHFDEIVSMAERGMI